jgi:1-acyl-sn-glycerol-3-phosphate acyltransferase
VSNVDTRLVGQSRGSRVAYWFVRGIVATVTKLYTRLRVDGIEHLPTSGAYVLAPVHRSFVDTPIAATLTRRRLRFMGKHTLWKNRSFGWIISSLGAFPVTRGTADREALNRCITVVESGEPLVLFPEGERKSGPVVQPLFDGAVYVAARAGIPIVPVGIAGSERVMPKGKRFIYPRRVYAIVGEPIAVPPSDRGRVSRAAVRRTSEQLHTILQTLFDEAWARLGEPPS